jgi:SAM-dependent methyltransferase
MKEEKHTRMSQTNNVNYLSQGKIAIPPLWKTIASRIAFPVLTLLSRENSLKLGLTPIDDERVIMALRYAKGKLLDVGCGANNLVRSHGQGTGVDVVAWDGCDVVVEDTAKLPFEDESYDSVSYLACLNHIHNRGDAVKEAHRVLKPGGVVIVTMITPKMGRFIHWWRRSHDPDEKERHIDHSNELLGMSPSHVMNIMRAAGFKNIKRKRFAYGMNNLYVAEK